MAGDKGEVYCDDVLDWALGNSNSLGTTQTTHYLRLFTTSTTDPVTTSALTEASGSGYAALPLVNSGYVAETNTLFAAAASSTTNNSGGVAAWTAQGGTLGGAELVSWAITKGNGAGADILYWGDGISATVADGNTYELTLTITEE